jgi:hypothetical protein
LQLSGLAIVVVVLGDELNPVPDSVTVADKAPELDGLVGTRWDELDPERLSATRSPLSPKVVREEAFPPARLLHTEPESQSLMQKSPPAHDGCVVPI